MSTWSVWGSTPDPTISLSLTLKPYSCHSISKVPGHDYTLGSFKRQRLKKNKSKISGKWFKNRFSTSSPTLHPSVQTRHQPAWFSYEMKHLQSSHRARKHKLFHGKWAEGSFRLGWGETMACCCLCHQVTAWHPGASQAHVFQAPG